MLRGTCLLPRPLRYHDEDLGVARQHLLEVDDVGVLDLAHDRDLALDLLGHVLLLDQVLVQELDRDRAAGLGVDGALVGVQGGLEEDVKVVRILLERGADPNAKDMRSQTILMHCALHNWEDVASLAVDRGAKLYATDRHGWTALHFA